MDRDLSRRIAMSMLRRVIEVRGDLASTLENSDTARLLFHYKIDDEDRDILRAEFGDEERVN